MTEISAEMVRQLREATNVGMMECKKALLEAKGDKDAAIKILRERGLATAAKKATRTANQGQVAAEVFDGGKVGVMLEVNCETDFVARNTVFQTFVADLVKQARQITGSLAEAAKDAVVAKVTQIGENLVVRRNLRFDLQGTGLIASYVHMGGKVGVLIEVACQKPETVNQPAFLELVKDLTLHIAACNPAYLQPADVPADVVAAEKDIYAKQVPGNKPPNIMEKIVTGKLEKYYEQVCLVRQPFVKEPDMTITQLLEAKGKAVGDQLAIRRYARYQLGVD